MAEEIIIPATSESSDSNYPEPGTQLFKIVDIAIYKDKNGTPKKDSRGYPGLTITFKNEQGKTIADNFYYSDKPLDHPSRMDKDKKCASEYFLDKLKRACGFKSTDTLKASSLIGKKLWIPIGVKHFLHRNSGEVVAKFVFMIKDFYPGDGDKPIIAGDPTLKAQGGIPAGEFLVEEVDLKGKYKARESSSGSESSYQDDESSAEEPEIRKDMDVDEF